MGYLLSLKLSNPKTFRPLLLFIGFIFAMIGLGWWGFKEDNSIFMSGNGNNSCIYTPPVHASTSRYVKKESVERDISSWMDYYSDPNSKMNFENFWFS